MENNVNVTSNVNAKKASFYAIATGSNKKDCRETFGRISFPENDPKKVVSICEDMLTNFAKWTANVKALKAEAERVPTNQLLATLSVEELQAELARRSQS